MYIKHKVSANKGFEICQSPTTHKPSEEDKRQAVQAKQRLP